MADGIIHNEASIIHNEASIIHGEASIIDGKAFAGQLRQQISATVSDLAAANIVPGLAVIIVGSDPSSQIYVRNKEQQTIEAGMNSYSYKLPEETTERSLLELIQKLNGDNHIDGILVQLPLPAHIDERRVINAVTPEKDVDGFHTSNVGRLATGQKSMIPCTPLGCLSLLRDRLGDLSGKNAVVVGRSNIVGKPMASLLLSSNCTVTIAHSRTINLPDVCRGADILIAAVGRPELIKGTWIKPGATVIDVGINRIASEHLGDAARDASGQAANLKSANLKSTSLKAASHKLVGDVDFASACKVAGAITPVPGGVGPMTIACLLLNCLTACLHRNELPLPAFANISAT